MDMGLKFCSFSSGSNGNCYLVKSDNTAILVDAGISAKKILNGLSETNTNEVDAILITHEHSDHIRSLSTISKRLCGLKTYANKKTWLAIDEKLKVDNQNTFITGESFKIGDIGINSFSVSHDAAEPVGYSFFKGGKQISIVTDTGLVDEGLYREIKNADILVLEANHDVDMLKIGKYPWFLKQRILGDNGHLSNESAAEILVRLLSEKEKKRKIFLAHLSRENNFPEMAYQTVKNILEEGNYYIGKHLELATIIRDEVSLVYQA